MKLRYKCIEKQRLNNHQYFLITYKNRFWEICVEFLILNTKTTFFIEQNPQNYENIVVSPPFSSKMQVKVV